MSLGAAGLGAADSPVVIADAGPLIALARLDALHLLAGLYGQVSVPQTVWQEATAGGVFADSARIVAAQSAGTLLVIPDTDLDFDSRGNSRAALALLDEGELAAIAQALHLRTQGRSSLLVLDDAAARAAAQRQQLPLIGTVGILLRSKERGLIEAVAPLLRALQDNAYFVSPQLVSTALMLAHEK
jgi:predicted nucleic acid-binding protein